jgi:type VI secretion system secreted protein Hcp
MTRVRFLGALATAMFATTGPAFAEGPPTAGAALAPATAQTTAAVPAASRAAAFLRIDGPQGMIQGESNDTGHRGWIEISSFQMGTTQGSRAGAAPGSAAGAGRVNISEINITKNTDKASAALRTAFAAGTHLKDAIVELAKPNGDGRTVVYYRVTLNDVLVSADRGAAMGAAVPTESLTLNFGKIVIEYAPQKPDGSTGSYSPVQEGWDVKSNVKM